MHSPSHPESVQPFSKNRRRSPAQVFSATALALALSAGALLVSGCGALVVGGVAAGAVAAYDRRSYNVVIDDEGIELRAVSAFLTDPQIKGRGRISATSYNYNVLLTGQADSAETARRATELVSSMPKVRRVVDEISIGPTISMSQESEDTYLTSRAKLALTDVEVPGFDASRVKVVTENGVVYLMGLVTPQEADAAAEKVRYVSGVKRVVKLFEYIERPT